MPIEVFFNRPGQPVPVERLYREIRDARHRLTVASAWFTDTHLADAILDSPAPDKLVLLNAADLGRGDKRAVKMIKEASAATWKVYDEWSESLFEEWASQKSGAEPWNIDEFTQFTQEQERSGPPLLRLTVLGSRDFTQGVMHHKFIAIDDRMVWTGSFNFTFNAQRNYENLVRIDDPDIVRRYHEEAKACAYAKEGDDESGMVRCPECDKTFYPDEAQLVDIDSHGGVMCTQCTATASVVSAFDILPDPRITPPGTTNLLAAKRQVRISKK